MSTSKKPLKKRKRQSPSPSKKSHISQRLEKIRNGQRNLWDDDDDDDNNNVEPCVQRKIPPSNNTYIVLSDSDEEKRSSRQQSTNKKSKKKSSRTQDENLSSDNDYKMASKCPTCLICSILTTLTSYNCCSKHLSLLVHNKNPQKQTTDTEQWPPQQVMIVPMTDEFIQRYFHSQEIHRLHTRTLISPPTDKNPKSSKRSTKKSSKKSTVTSEASDTEHSNTTKSKTSRNSSQTENDQINSSSSIIPADATYTVITSTSSTINSFESPNVLDTCQLQQSSDQPIIIDDSQPENVLSANTTQGNKQNDPWTPISDETYAAIEQALDQNSQTSEEQPEFTPATARRTPTDLMASRLPKIQLKKGRFHKGKPISEKSTPDTTTNECQSMTISQSSTTSTTTSVIITNSTRAPTALATIIEDESLIIQSTRQTSDKSSQSSHILSEKHDNTGEGLSDTVMNNLLAQDESSQHDSIPIPTKIIPSQVLPSTSVIIEDIAGENDANRSETMSQSSQLTNDQSDTQPLISSTTNEKTLATPARVSYRMNPDGSRVSLSRAAVSTNHQSPLRRISTDVNSTITSHANK